MMFIELFIPKGTVSEEQRHRLSQRLITEFMTEEEEQSAPTGVIEASRALQQVVVHEPDTWIVGGRPVDPNEPPRYLVRVSLPSSWRKPMSAEVISRVTRVLAEADPNPQRLYQESVAWVHVIGVPEGSYGTLGKALEGTDIVKMITRPFRESPERDALIKAAPPGRSAIDPVCGMTVPLTDAPFTLEHDGTTYAFCSAGCRQVFVEELGSTTSQ
jgi:YHS domain-containing protein